MRTLKQVNEYYSSTGYTVERVNGAVEVSFEGNHVWTFAKGYKVAQVVEAMSEMPWLAWGNNSCELSVSKEETEPCDNSNTVITKSQAMDLGFCFQYHTNDIQVYRPDGSSFYATDLEQALAWISGGTHLCTYAEPLCCDIVITPLLSGTVPSPVSYWSEADAMPQTRMDKEATLLTALGYDPNEHWVDLSTGEVWHINTVTLVGNTSEQRW